MPVFQEDEMLKKFLMFPVCCLVLLALALPSQAKEVKFAHFSIDVPAGCNLSLIHISTPCTCPEATKARRTVSFSFMRHSTAQAPLCQQGCPGSSSDTKACGGARF